MSVYRRGSMYIMDFEFKGKRHKKSTGVKIGGNDAKTTAENIERAYRLKLAKREAGIAEPDPAPSFKEFTERFLKWVAAQRAERPRTILFYKTRVRCLLKFEPFKTVNLADLDAGMIAKFVEWRQGTKRTKVIRRAAVDRKGKPKLDFVESKKALTVGGINAELRALRRILNVAHEWRVIPFVPKVHTLPGARQHERVLTHAEELAYLDDATPLLQDFASLLLDTGLRPQDEALRIRWEHVHFTPAPQARFGYIHNPHGKTARAKRDIPMTPRVRDVLIARHEAAGKPAFGFVFPGDDARKPLPYSTITSAHRRVVKRLKLEALRLYDLRHTFLTRYGMSGGDAFSIQKIAGHSSILMSQRYVHPTPERIEDGIARLTQYNAERIAKATESAQANRA